MEQARVRAGAGFRVTLFLPSILLTNCGGAWHSEWTKRFSTLRGEPRMRDPVLLPPATPTTVSDESRTEAQVIQVSLLPKCTLRGAGFEVAFRFSPLDDVGGDFADYFLLPNGHVVIYVGDVVGKRLITAMYGALVMGTMRGTNKTGEDPAAVLGLLIKRLMVRPV